MAKAGNEQNTALINEKNNDMIKEYLHLGKLRRKCA